MPNEQPSTQSRSYLCQLCTLTFSDQKSLTEHYWSMLHNRKLSKDKGGSCSHKCTLCDEHFVGLLSFCQHIHGDEHGIKVDEWKKLHEVAESKCGQSQTSNIEQHKPIPTNNISNSHFEKCQRDYISKRNESSNADINQGHNKNYILPPSSRRYFDSVQPVCANDISPLSSHHSSPLPNYSFDHNRRKKVYSTTISHCEKIPIRSVTQTDANANQWHANEALNSQSNSSINQQGVMVSSSQIQRSTSIKQRKNISVNSSKSCSPVAVNKQTENRSLASQTQNTLNTHTLSSNKSIESTPTIAAVQSEGNKLIEKRQGKDVLLTNAEPITTDCDSLPVYKPCVFSTGANTNCGVLTDKMFCPYHSSVIAAVQSHITSLTSPPLTANPKNPKQILANEKTMSRANETISQSLPVTSQSEPTRVTKQTHILDKNKTTNPTLDCVGNTLCKESSPMNIRNNTAVDANTVQSTKGIASPRPGLFSAVTTMSLSKAGQSTSMPVRTQGIFRPTLGLTNANRTREEPPIPNIRISSARAASTSQQRTRPLVIDTSPISISQLDPVMSYSIPTPATSITNAASAQTLYLRQNRLISNPAAPRNLTPHPNPQQPIPNQTLANAATVNFSQRFPNSRITNTSTTRALNPRANPFMSNGIMSDTSQPLLQKQLLSTVGTTMASHCWPNPTVSDIGVTRALYQRQNPFLQNAGPIVVSQPISNPSMVIDHAKETSQLHLKSQATNMSTKGTYQMLHSKIAQPKLNKTVLNSDVNTAALPRSRPLVKTAHKKTSIVKTTMKNSTEHSGKIYSPEEIQNNIYKAVNKLAENKKRKRPSHQDNVNQSESIKRKKPSKGIDDLLMLEKDEDLKSKELKDVSASIYELRNTIQGLYGDLDVLLAKESAISKEMTAIRESRKAILTQLDKHGPECSSFINVNDETDAICISESSKSKRMEEMQARVKGLKQLVKDKPTPSSKPKQNSIKAIRKKRKKMQKKLLNNIIRKSNKSAPQKSCCDSPSLSVSSSLPASSSEAAQSNEITSNYVSTTSSCKTISSTGYTGHTGPVTCLKTYGSYLCSCSTDKRIGIFNLKIGDGLLFDSGHKLGITSLEVFFENEKPRLCTGSNDCTVRIHCPAAQRCIRKFVFSARVLALHSPHLSDFLYVGLADGHVSVILLKKLTFVKRFQCHSNQPCAISCLTHHKLDGVQILFTGSYNKTIAWHNPANGKLTRVISDHTGKLLSLKVNGGKLYSGSTSCLVLVHCLKTGNLLAKYGPHQNGVTGICIFAGTLVTTSLDKLIRTFDTKTKTVLCLYGGGKSMVYTLCISQSGQVFCGYQNGEICNIDVNNNTILICKWGKCNLPFSTKDDIRLHLIDCHFNDQLSIDCQWEGCYDHQANRISKKVFFDHVDMHLMPQPYATR